MIDWDSLYKPERIEASLGQVSQIAELLYRANITPEQSHEIHRNYLDYDEQEAQETIEYLKANQIDMVDAGFNYGQTYLKWKLKQF